MHTKIKWRGSITELASQRRRREIPGGQILLQDGPAGQVGLGVQTLFGEPGGAYHCGNARRRCVSAPRRRMRPKPRFFFGFSHFRNSEKFNLWPLFEKEILPFCVSTGGHVPLDMWLRIRSGDPNPGGS